MSANRCEQVTVVTINNPFDPADRTIRRLPYTAGRTLDHYVDLTPPARDLSMVCAVNGKQIDLDAPLPIIRPGSFIGVCPEVGDSDIVKTVAMIALVAVAGAYGGTVGGALGLTGELATGVGAGLIMAGGALLVNAVLPPAMPDTPHLGTDAWNESPTYGWGPLQQTEGQGRAIPILFGRMRVAGQVISKFVSVSGNKQYYNRLLGVADGSDPVSISDIRINDQPVSYYKGVSTHTRPGAVDDAVIPGFDEVVVQQNFGQLLAYNAPVTHQTGGNAVEKIEFDIAAPYGIYYSNDQGGLDTRSVIYQIEYKPAADSTWQDGGSYTMTAASNQAVRETIVIDDLPAGQYDIRVTRQSADSSSPRERTAIYWTGIREVVKQALSYPGLAKYAVCAQATDQLSGGEPAITCLAERATVRIYNPYTDLWETKSATNPAWAYYALANTHHGIAKERMLYDEIKAWADYCDEQINGKPRFTINIYLDTQDNFWRNAQKICQIGRAQPLRRGSKYGVFADMPGTASQMFTMGNIVQGSFELEYLPFTDRANAVEITFKDAARDFTTQTVAVYSDEYNQSTAPDNKSSVRWYGCTDVDEVVRHGGYLLNNSKYLVRKIRFKADIDAISIQVGDLFYFMHDAPAWGESGRLVAATANDITLDKEVELKAGVNYAVLIRLADDTLLDKTIAAVDVDTTTAVLTFTTPLAPQDVPRKYDVYGFGTVLTYKRLYRLIQMGRTQNLQKSLTGVEYNDAIYNDQGFSFTAQALATQRQEAVQVYVHEFLRYGKNGSYTSNLNVAWHPSTTTSGNTWEIWLQDLTDGGPAVKAGTAQEMNFTVPAPFLVLGHQYRVIVTVAGEGPLEGVANYQDITIQGEAAPPSDVVSLSGSYDPETRTVNLHWPEVGNIDLAGYEIHSGGSSWGVGDMVEARNITDTMAYLYLAAETTGTVRYRVKAVDRSGNYSENEAWVDVVIAAVSTSLQVPTGLTITSSIEVAPDGGSLVSMYAAWNNNAEVSSAFHHYELEVVLSATGRGAQYSTTDIGYILPVIPNTSYDVRIRAVDKDGSPTAWSTFVNHISAKDTTPPADVSWAGGGGATAGFRMIGLEWNQVPDADVRDYRIQRSASGAWAGEEIDLGYVSGSFAIDKNLAVNTQYWYRIKARDTSGNESLNWSPIATATTTQIGQSDIAFNSILANHLVSGEIFTNSLKSTGYDSGAGYFLDGENNQIIIRDWGAVASMVGDAPAAGATANLPDSALLDRTNHTGVQDYATTVSGGPAADADQTQSALEGGVTITSGGLTVAPAAFDSTNRKYTVISDSSVKIAYRLNLSDPAQDVEYQGLNRFEFGTAINGVRTRIPGYFVYKPDVIVVPADLMCYSAAGGAAVNQSFKLDALDIAEYDATGTTPTPGSMMWFFTPEAKLISSASTKTDVYNSSSTGSGNVWTPWRRASTATVDQATIFVNVKSIRGTSTSAIYYKRRCRVRLHWSNDGANISGSTAWSGYYTIPDGGTVVAVTAPTASFAQGQWYVRAEVECSDAGGTYQSGATQYDYQNKTYTWSLSGSASVSGGSATTYSQSRSYTIGQANSSTLVADLNAGWQYYTQAGPFTVNWSATHTNDSSSYTTSKTELKLSYTLEVSNTPDNFGSSWSNSGSSSLTSSELQAKGLGNANFPAVNISLYAEVKNTGAVSPTPSASISFSSGTVQIPLRKPKTQSTTANNTVTENKIVWHLGNYTTFDNSGAVVFFARGI